MNRLDGKIAVVTGGCSGIGLATVERFAAEGARVLLADVREDAGSAIAGRLGQTVRFQRCDVTREADIEAAMAAAVEAWGKLDIVFNNAGAGGSRAPIDEISGTSVPALRARNGANATRSSRIPMIPATAAATRNASGSGIPASASESATNAAAVKMAACAKFRMSSTPKTSVYPTANSA